MCELYVTVYYSLHKKLMFTMPDEEENNGQGSDEVVEKRDESIALEDREVEKNGAEEELIQVLIDFFYFIILILIN